MAERVVVGTEAAAHARQMLAAAQRFGAAVQQVTGAASALAGPGVWEGAAAEQFRAEQRIMAARLQAVGPAVVRMATGAATVIQEIDREDAAGLAGGATVPAPTTAPQGGFTPLTFTSAYVGHSALNGGGGPNSPDLGAKIGNDLGQILLGLGMVVLGGGGEIAGVGLDATGVGAAIGIPANIVSAGVIAGGAGLVANGAIDLGRNVAAMSSASGSASGGGGSADGGTKPSERPDPNAKPSGRRTVVQGDPGTRRALELENESADTLAKAGYDVEQNPDVAGPKNPDYRIEGRIFDNYAPKGNENTVYQTIQDKVTRQQADRLVLNLADSRQDAGTITQWLKDYPVNGLKEVIFINKDGSIQDLVLP